MSETSQIFDANNPSNETEAKVVKATVAILEALNGYRSVEIFSVICNVLREVGAQYPINEDITKLKNELPRDVGGLLDLTMMIAKLESYGHLLITSILVEANIKPSSEECLKFLSLMHMIKDEIIKEHIGNDSSIPEPKNENIRKDLH